MIFQFRRIEGGAVEDGKLVGGQVKVRNINAETREEAEEKLRLMDENPEVAELYDRRSEGTPGTVVSEPDVPVFQSGRKIDYVALALKQIEEELADSRKIRDDLDREFPGVRV